MQENHQSTNRILALVAAGSAILLALLWGAIAYEEFGTVQLSHGLSYLAGGGIISALLLALALVIAIALRRGRRRELILRESEARFRSLVEFAFDTYWEQDTEFRFTVIDGAAADARRGLWNSMLGRKRWELPNIATASGDWSAHQADLTAHRPFRDLVLRRVDQTGREFWMSVSGEPMFSDSGAFKGYRGVSKEVTERVRAEQMQVLEHAVNRVLATAEDVSWAMRAVLHAVCEAMGWECGAYWSVVEGSAELRIDQTWLSPSASEGSRQFIDRSRSITVHPGEGLVGVVWQTGEQVWVADTETDPRVRRRDLARECGMRAALLFPVLADGVALGVMDFPSALPHRLDERLLEAARVIGNQVGQFLRRKESERVLRESEARFRSLTELSSDWYWEQDAQFRFTRVVGPSHLPTATMLGKTRWELPGTRLSEEQWQAHRADMEARKPFRDFLNPFVAADGTRGSTSVNGEPVFGEDGRFLGYRGTARDVTGAVQREEELRRFRAAIDASADLVLLVDPKTLRYVDVNDAACRKLGYTREELLAIGPTAIFSATRGDLMHVYRRLIVDDHNEPAIEGWYRCKDGSRVPVESFRRVVRTQDGHVIVAVARDISARREAELRARERDLQQSMIAALGQQALQRLDLDKLMRDTVRVVSETLGTEFCSLLEIEPDAAWLVLKAGVGYEPDWYGRRIMELTSNTSPATAVRTRQPVVVDDFEAMPSASQSTLGRSHRIRSSLIVPIPVGDGVYGTLGVHAHEPRQFSAEHTAFLQSIANILAAAIERGRAEERLARLAQFDTTTGLPNRVLFRDRLEQMLVQATRNRSHTAVLFIDLDRFKLVNDTLGHSYGDVLLARVAERISNGMRAGDTAGRLSGDEFAVVLTGLARSGDAALVAQKLIDALAVPFDLGGHKSYITASIGIAVHPSDGADADALLKNADSAMYRVKSSGRNAYQFYMPEMNERAVERLGLESDLRGALDRGEFSLCYQPRVRLRGHRIVGFEALLRWTHPQRGSISPEIVIPLLEDTGLIVAVGEWVLREVCRQIRAWREAGLATPSIAINLSARQLQRRDLDTVIHRVLDEHDVKPSLIEVEITESILMEDTESAVRTLRTLKDAGVRVSVDDFGTGYSSLSYLRSFPLDALKIDRSFIDGVGAGGDDAAIALAIISLAHSLKLEVVAEGVETAEQLAFLVAHGCDTAQGYLFSRPVEAAVCENMLRAGMRLKPPKPPAR